MMKSSPNSPLFALTLALTLPLAFALTAGRAEVIGIEEFDYADGTIINRSGGMFWDWSQNTATPAHTGSASDWDTVTLAPVVSDGRLLTRGDSTRREFNGADESEGAFNGTDVVYFRTTMTRDAAVTWSGLSSYEFGDERIFFGVPGTPNPATNKRAFGIQVLATSSVTYSRGEPVAGDAYTIVAKLDFDGNMLSMWINPDLSQPEEYNGADVTVPYTGTNWCTAVRLGSGGSGRTDWEELIVATTWAEIAPPRIANPSFEAGGSTLNPGYTSIPGWESSDLDRTGVNPTVNGSPFADNGVIPDGGRVAFIQSSGSLEYLLTNITGLQPGTHYKVSFRVNSRALYDRPIASWSVNGSDFAISDTSSVGAANQYRLAEGTFLATETTAPLIIQNNTPGDSTLLLDDFRIEVDHSVFTTTEADGELTITGYDLAGSHCPIGPLVIPASIGGKPVTSIVDPLFYGCSDLTKVTLPAGLTSIGFFPFGECSSLLAIDVDGGNLNYSSHEGVLFDKEQTTLLQFPCGKSGTYTVPPGVTSIERHAFRNCNGLTAVTLPAGLTSIRDRAFQLCRNLTAVTLPAELTSIAQEAFERCSSLTAVTLPAGLTSIGNSAFFECGNLEAFFFLGDAPALGNDFVFAEAADGAKAYYVPGTSGWSAPGGNFTSFLTTALWDPAARITSVALTNETIDVTWLPFLPVADPSYRIESSPDGQTWAPINGLENVTTNTASVPRPSGATRLLLRVRGNGG